ncbi:hypothetical protein E6H34_05425 [Candidatus Bathyarchaeota archaeon]|nr:MAG: hypothetical protein E6H34_05425 [Candidatus Bathyarchaeota archaeon]
MIRIKRLVATNIRARAINTNTFNLEDYRFFQIRIARRRWQSSASRFACCGTTVGKPIPNADPSTLKGQGACGHGRVGLIVNSQSVVV